MRHQCGPALSVAGDVQRCVIGARQIEPRLKRRVYNLGQVYLKLAVILMAFNQLAGAT